VPLSARAQGSSTKPTVRIELLELSGFEIGEIDLLLDGAGVYQEDDLPEMKTAATPGGPHG